MVTIAVDMKKFVLLLCVAAILVLAGSAEASIPEPYGQHASDWTHLTLNAGFIGSAGSKPNVKTWTYSWFGGSTKNGVTTSPANVREDGNGHLVLKLSSSPSSTSSGVGALVDTNPVDGGTPGHTYGASGFQIGYGTYVEARIWLPGSGSTVDDFPAFWTNGQNWPQDGEIDMLEGLSTAKSYYHWGCAAQPTASCVVGSGPIPGAWAGSWHIYGVDREAGENYVYWDGKLVFKYPTYDGGANQYIVLNIGAAWAPFVVPSVMKVDYVRVWSH